MVLVRASQSTVYPDALQVRLHKRNDPMALLNVLLSGAWRVSVAGGESAAKGFSALSPLLSLIHI